MELTIIPITTGLVQVLKLSLFKSADQKKLLPLITLCTALFLTLFNEMFQPTPDLGLGFFKGLIYGLSACGLYETAVSPVGDLINEEKNGKK